MHSGANINLIIDGDSGNLNLESSYFIGTHSYSPIVSLMAGQHDASQIWVSVQDGEMTLFNALQSPNRLCPNPTKPTAYSSSNIPDPGHLATEILLTASGKTFQAAINDGDFCGCTSGSTKTYTCPDSPCANYGTITLVCQPSGIWQNIVCTPLSYVGRGTRCGTDKTCDGAGNCIGYSGTGCGSCPFGTEASTYATWCALSDSNGKCYYGKWYNANHEWTSWSLYDRIAAPIDGAHCSYKTYLDLSEPPVYSYWSWKMKPSTCPTATSETTTDHDQPETNVNEPEEPEVSDPIPTTPEPTPEPPIDLPLPEDPVNPYTFNR